MDERRTAGLLAVLRAEMVSAMGCTEPAAVTLAGAAAAGALREASGLAQERLPGQPADEPAAGLPGKRGRG